MRRNGFRVWAGTIAIGLSLCSRPSPAAEQRPKISPQADKTRPKQIDQPKQPSHLNAQQLGRYECRDFFGLQFREDPPPSGLLREVVHFPYGMSIALGAQSGDRPLPGQNPLTIPCEVVVSGTQHSINDGQGNVRESHVTARNIHCVVNPPVVDITFDDEGGAIFSFRGTVDAPGRPGTLTGDVVLANAILGHPGRSEVRISCNHTASP